MRACYLISRICILSAMVLASPMALSQAGLPGLPGLAGLPGLRSGARPTGRTRLLGRRRSGAEVFVVRGRRVGARRTLRRWPERRVVVGGTRVGVARTRWRRGRRRRTARQTRRRIERRACVVARVVVRAGFVSQCGVPCTPPSRWRAGPAGSTVCHSHRRRRCRLPGRTPPWSGTGSATSRPSPWC